MTDKLKAAVERAWSLTAARATGDKHDVTSNFIRALADEPEVIKALHSAMIDHFCNPNNLIDHFCNPNNLLDYGGPGGIKAVVHRLAEIVK